MLAVAAVWLLLSPSALLAENWPQWRGPAFNGSSPETGLPTKWSRTEGLVWAAPLPGYAGSTPIVWGGYVFVNTPDEQKNLLLICLNRKDGSVRWKKQVAAGDIVKGRNNMASPSPATDGKRIIAMFGTGDVAAFDLDGKELWRRDLAREYGKFANMWIYGASPLLFDGKLFIQVLQRDTPANYAHAKDDKPTRESFLLCLDPATGKDLWRHVRDTDAQRESRESYATPLPFKGPAGWEIILVGGDYVTGHDPATGAEIWRSAGLNPRQTDTQKYSYRIVPSPVAARDMVVACGPKGQPVIAVKAGGKGDITQSHRAWTFSDVTPDWSTPLYYQNQLFILDGNKRILARVDPKTGEKKWSGEIDPSAQIWSSPTGADGKIYCVNEQGTVIVASAGGEFKILGANSFGDESPTRSSVVVSNGELFVRTAKNLYCIGGRK